MSKLYALALMATLAGGSAGWLLHGSLVRPALAAGPLQGQTTSGSGAITAIAVCFGTASPPAGWSTTAATVNALANGNHRIVAVVPANGPAGCSNPEIVWGQTP